MQLVILGVPYRKIAADVGVGYGTVVRDIEARLEEGAEERQGKTHLYREKQRRQLNTLLTAWWTKAVHDPAAADRVLRILEREAKLIGLDAPQRKQIEGPDGGPISVKPDLSGLTIDELKALCALVGKSQGGPASSR